MVFPSKNRDPRHDLKIDKNADKRDAGHNAQTKKPLRYKKIYLDVKNHSVSSKLEGSLKLLGATIEVFLVKDVNLVVTDRQNWCSGSPLPSPSLQTPTGTCPESPATTDSQGGEQGPRSARSRAEAMLEKALLQPKQISLDPLDNAVHWGISIWSLDKVLKWLEKVNSASKTHSQDSRFLEKPFIKLETSHRHCPSYKEFSVWPTIALDFDAGGCPFNIPKNNLEKSIARPNEDTEKADTTIKGTDGLSENSRMTRKARSKLQDVCSVRLPGYCEICQVKYSDQKTHVQSESHLQFVNNDRNFVSLDLLIKKRSSMDAFLQLNGASELTQCSMLGNPRRSLRSVLKLTSLDGQSLPQDIVLPNGQHATRASTLNMRQTLDEKHLSKVAHHEPLEILCNGMVNHNYETRHGSKVSAPVRRSFWDERAKPRRTRTSSATFCNFSEDEPLQLSPTGSDLGHHLRSRGQVPASKSIPADDEKISRVCEMQSMPVQCAKDEPDKPNCVSRDSKSKEILHKPCRGNSEVIRKKRPSAEEKLIEDNKAYYKLELKNSKLRSSRYFIPHKVSESDHTKTETICDKANVSFSNTNGEKIVEDCISVKVMEETVVKVKKKQRRSELSVLSDEAESFMFGEPSRQDSSYESTEEEGEASLAKEYNQVYTQNTGGNSSKTKKDGECVKLDESNSRLTPLHCDESSLGSVASSCDTGSTRRKRRTHAEAFIHDNLDYYKFEIPGSRLRHQGSNSPNTSACKSVKESKLVDTNEVSVQVSLSPSSVELGQEEKLENVSHSENVIAPRDLESDHHSAAETGTKHLSAYGSALQGLQYSFELVPESEPWYQTYKRQDEGEEIYFPQCESFRWRTFLLPYEIPSSDIHGSTTEAPALGETGGLRFKKKRRNKYAHLLDSKPRKSPRCHASTLAILSSLRHNRKRRETEKREQSLAAQECSTVDESSQDVSVEAVSSKSEVCDPELAEPFREIEKNFEKLLTTDKEDNLSIDINVQDCELSVASGSSDVPPKFPSTERRRNSHSLRRKSAQSSRKLNGVNSNKQSSEITPVSLEGRRHSCKEQLSGVVCLPKPRSGLDSDVVELLDSCWCFDKDTRNCRDCTAPKCDAMLSLSELSCNSSECSVASTCDSSLFSELLGKNSKSCTKKRKKKKNLTGWPIERHRKKGMKKIAEEDDDCTCDIKCSLDDCNKTEGKLSNVDAVSLVIMDNRDGPVRMPNDVNRAENNVDVSANVVRTAKYVDSTANNSDRVVGDLDRAGDNVDRTSGNSDRVAKSNGRGADNVERKEGTMIESEQSSNLEGRSNLVPNTSDKIGDVENARQNGLSDTNSCITNSCPQVNTTMIGSCRVDSSVNNVVEEPFVKDLRGCEDEDISCGAVSSSSVNTKTTKHGLTRTVSLEASRQSCELQPCVRVTKITNLADMLSYSQGAVVANSRRLRSASSPSTMSSPPRRSQEYDVQPRRASPRKRVSKGWDVLISKKR